MWSPRGLQEKLRSIVPAHTSVDAKQTRAELREMAYKFNNGPFRKLWILRGFDPRLSKNNVGYQLYEIKLPNSWYNKKDSTLFPKVQKSIQQSRTIWITMNFREAENQISDFLHGRCHFTERQARVSYDCREQRRRESRRDWCVRARSNGIRSRWHGDHFRVFRKIWFPLQTGEDDNF